MRKVLSLYRGAGATAANQDHARDQARQRAEIARRTASHASSSGGTQRQVRGEKVYMSRGKNNRIVFTTAQPKPN